LAGRHRLRQAHLIRAAVPKDFASLREIELAAGQLFAEIGMDEIANAEPSSLDALRRYSDSGHAWVLVDAREAPVGFALVDLVDGCAHIEQISIHPRHHRHGYGRMLIYEIATWAQDRGMPAVTLTTFRDVLWNAPYYERCGFQELAQAELTPGMAEVRARETNDGLDPRTRVCMRLDLHARTGDLERARFRTPPSGDVP
jgi:GNAT superfamily N-acetyltransferase